jgi:hypothetical protein
VSRINGDLEPWKLHHTATETINTVRRRIRGEKLEVEVEVEIWVSVLTSEALF